MDDNRAYAMSWLEEAQAKLNRKNHVLFAKDAMFLQDIMILLQNENHRTLVLWALDLASESVANLEERYADERRPREAVAAARDWASGKIKMQLAQRKILDCHAFAKEIDNKEDIALCHAIGQACATVHTVGHAIGYPMYDLTSVIYKYGIEHCFEAVEARKQAYIDKLFYWHEHLCDYTDSWADFMLK